MRVASLPDYAQTSSYGFGCRRLSPGKAAYDSPDPSDSGRASKSMNAVLREHLAPSGIAAVIVTPTHRPATTAYLPPTYSTRTSTAVSSAWWQAGPLLGRKATGTAYPPCLLQGEPEGSTSSALVSAPDYGHLRFLGRSETENHNPPREPISWTLWPVGTRS